MESSLSITKIAASLLKAQSEMGNAVKSATNPFFKKQYADLNSVREAILPVLNKHGVSVIQPMCIINGEPFIETILLHESGEFISSFAKVVVDKPNDAQRHGSGISYARRYALQSIVNIGADDDDANSISGKVAENKPAAASWHLSPAQQKEMDKLIKNSTLDAPGKDNAALAVVKCPSQAELDRIKAKLLTLQN
jgi:hypothetical protein